jgi:quinol-cytochrome oxidoreductase complex cytochrome b subunit
VESAYWRPFEVLWLSYEESIANSNSEFDACKNPALRLIHSDKVWRQDYQNLQSTKVLLSVLIKFCKIFYTSVKINRKCLQFILLLILTVINITDALGYSKACARWFP